MASQHPFEYIIALGSNLGERRAFIRKAIDQIREILGPILAESQMIATKPIGNADQEFINGAIWISSTVNPATTMTTLLEIEGSLGRERSVQQGNRTIDLDIILAWHNQISLEVNTSQLTIPHPQTFNRDFVVIPLLELLQSKFNAKP